ncbi:hypothetical protein [Burkholderia pyrrocinia]|nr:hypothetical protein [Burkholderia pyrrocinia]
MMTVSLARHQGSSLKDKVLALFLYIFGDIHHMISVQTTSIDALRIEHGAFDIWSRIIEGAEGDALSGGMEMLGRCPPRAIVAGLFGDLRHVLRHRLSGTPQYGYRVFLRKHDHEPEFAEVDVEPGEMHRHTSPTFGFSRETVT